MSKANQKFVQADEAVSPVIGVILMVAITVVLAAVVFVLVSNLSKTSNKAPDVSFSTDETADRITMVKGATGLNWDDFEIKGTEPSGADVRYSYNANAHNSGSTLGTSYAPFASAVFDAGDFIDFCGGDGVGSDATGTTITGITTVQILHRESNTIVYETQFNGIVAC